MPSKAVQNAIASIHKIDRSKQRLYDWETTTFRDKWANKKERRYLWDDDNPLDLESLQSLSDLLCGFGVIRPVKVKIKPGVIKGVLDPAGNPIPASFAPRYYHQVWIDPSMRQPAMVAHEVAHKVAQNRTSVMNHGPIMQGWYALLASKLVPFDQVSLHRRIITSMRRRGLKPE